MVSLIQEGKSKYLYFLSWLLVIISGFFFTGDNSESPTTSCTQGNKAETAVSGVIH